MLRWTFLDKKHVSDGFCTVAAKSEKQLWMLHLKLAVLLSHRNKSYSNPSMTSPVAKPEKDDVWLKWYLSCKYIQILSRDKYSRLFFFNKASDYENQVSYGSRTVLVRSQQPAEVVSIHNEFHIAKVFSTSLNQVPQPIKNYWLQGDGLNHNCHHIQNNSSLFTLSILPFTVTFIRLSCIQCPLQNSSFACKQELHIFCHDKQEQEADDHVAGPSFLLSKIR